jgi:hypothetical protein
LPSYSTHRRVYEIIGLSAGYCFVNDRIVDEDPPFMELCSHGFSRLEKRDDKATPLNPKIGKIHRAIILREGT